MSYRDTLNLPKTDFPMKADLSRREPEWQARWEEMDLYAKIRRARKGAKRFVLHDGPPYATGDLHIGTVMNKVLKDMVVRYHTMLGEDSPYVPGWDCHGLPIEHMVMQQLGAEYKKKTPGEIRRLCRECATRYVDYQRGQFKRFGVSGDWRNPYLTMTPHFEAGVMEVLEKILAEGYIYRELRPIHWCPNCETALAEAELEYHDIEGPSIYVKFKTEDDMHEAFGIKKDAPIYLLVWTTTPWTLPANVAVALGPGFDYAAVEAAGEVLVMAEATVERVMSEAGVEGWKTLARRRGDELEGMIYRHPLVNRDGRLILADFVTLEQGTGTVHIAPGHGKEDYDIGRKYGLKVLSPVNEQGRFTEEFEAHAGERVFDADKRITDDLRELGMLFHHGRFLHAYPHCWRCKKPVIFRATKQWFVSVDHKGLRRRIQEEIKKVRWIPAWGKIRITNMMGERPDWCISRQRYWGVPIPALYCRSCESAILSPEVVRRAREVFAEHGADSWFTHPLERFLPEDFRCPYCKAEEFDRENDILDVWFESGSSYNPILRHTDPPLFPADIYLEGTDQHRGWFQTSLITSVSAFGTAPYRQVLTHGFVVDESGKKMSKSLGNFLAVDDVIKKYGADIVRLWIFSVDYKDEIPASLATIAAAADPYRKIRNTFRFLLGNLYDFDPAADAVESDRLEELDMWALSRLQQVIDGVHSSFADYDFHRAFRRIYEFCAVDMSTFYFDVLKDTLYCERAESPLRRSAQTALWHVLHALVRLLAPVLVHTCEEVWAYHKPPGEKEESVHLALLPRADPALKNERLLERYGRLQEVRREVARSIEALRNEKKIGSSMQAGVVLHAEDRHLHALLESFGAENLSRLFISGAVSIEDAPPEGAVTGQDVHTLHVLVSPTSDPKCARCWRHRADVGADSARPDVCARCAEVLAGTEA